MATRNKTDRAAIRSAINKSLNETDTALSSIQDTVANITGGIDALEPDRVALQDIGVTQHESKGLQLDIKGKDKKYTSLSAQRATEKEIEKRYKYITQYSAGGMWQKLFMAKQNKYIANEFPNLKKSLKLFMTDVCYGSYFSEYDNTNSFFVIKKDGVVVDDKNIIDTINGILSPSTTQSDDVNKRSIFDIDFEASIQMGQDGYAMVRNVPTAKTLVDLYVKYVLKKSKSNSIEAVSRNIIPTSVESLDVIKDYLNDIGYDVMVPSMETNLALLPPQILSNIPSALIVETEVSKATAKETVPFEQLDGFESFEEHEFGNESFEEFAYRCLSGATSPMGVYKNSTENSNMRHYYKMGLEASNIPPEIGLSIYNEFFLNGNERNIAALESAVPIIANRLGVIDTQALSKVTYEELYALNTNSIATKITKYMEDTITYGLESHVGGVMNLSKPSLSLSPIEQVVRKVLVGDGSIMAGLERSVVNDFEKFTEEYTETYMAGLEATVKGGRSMINPSDVEMEAADVFLKKGKASVKATASAKFDESIDKAFKLFNHIKGGASVVLDNRRLIPLMMGNKSNGAIYIENTHAEVEHLIATRSTMTNPLAGGDTSLSLFQINEEDKESTISRLVFSDTIKPMFERNVSTKFLRDNSDIMYTLKELMEENELSLSDRRQGMFADTGFFNLSKISYIPPDELIMYSNGEGLGESRFENAFVPANAYILARESYQSWLLVDGKGVCFITYPKGLNEVPNSYGGNPLEQIISDLMVSRISLKMGSTDNLRLSKPIAVIPSAEGEADKIDIKDIQPPDFQIDNEIINRWQEEATGLVGYPASLFTDLSGGGNHPELARKMESLDASIVLDIQEVQDRKAKSTTALATKLLHMRGGSDYSNYIVEWVPPRPSRAANNIKKETVQEKGEVLTEYENIFAKLYEDRDDWATVKSYFLEELKNDMFKDDKYISKSKDYLQAAREKLKVDLSKKAVEER